MENFSCKLHRVLDFSYICSDRLYIDVGKETCPLHNSVSPAEAQIYLWRRCCIRHHLDHLYDGSTPKSGQNFYHESMLRDAGGMTTLTPPKSRLRRGGILYGQMYNLTKEIIDAARTFPFQNPDLRHLALDPQLRHGMRNICGNSIFVDFVWHNIDKFTTGFEPVRAQRVLELPQPVGSPQVRHGLGFGQTLEQHGYCWFEHLIDWGQLRFLPDITNIVLFGTGTLQQRY
ncbi:hypothetical protein EDB81DRAFT_671314, partial [Dactylonectria macrodidyma]